MPLNWNTTTDEQELGPRAAIAIIKLPSQVPVTDPRYGGPVILNPGGPGESGVYQVLTDGKNLQTILDAEVESSSTQEASSAYGKYFDILSFDPRGVNNTTPRLRCFSTASDQLDWVASLPDYGMLWHSESIVGMEWARAEALGASCASNEGEDGILRHLNTAQTVEDMVQIIEKEGEWRENEATRLLASVRNTHQQSTHEIAERTAYQPGQEKVQYWGMSYGTIIGSTFAAMHPDRVHRLVIDGVVDPADHYAGSWLTQLQDSDTIISKFCEYCFRAGRGRCPIYADSSAAIEARFTSILLNLKASPIAMLPSALDKGSVGPALVTYGDAHLLLLSAMYFPFAVAEDFFGILQSLEARNASSPALAGIVSKKQAQMKRPGCESYESPSLGRVPYVSGMGPFQAISCMDTGGPAALTREDFNEYLVELQSQGQWIGPSWARNKLACLGYSTPPAWKPALTFEAQEWTNTSHPLLIIGNSHDTVTPLRNARRVSTLFPGSVVLQQDSEGHCSHSSPSLCTARTVREYFQTGKLPQDGTICSPETRPFLGCAMDGRGNGSQCKYVDDEDTKLWEVMGELADPFGLRR